MQRIVGVTISLACGCGGSSHAAADAARVGDALADDAMLPCGGPDSWIPAWATSFQPAHDFYVSPTGADTNDGTTPATAFQTIQQALTVFGPGVRLDVAAGTYSGDVYVQDMLGGTAQPGEIRSSDGPHAAVIDGTMYLSHAKGVIVDGFELATAGSTGHGFQIDSGSGLATLDLSTDIVIRNMSIHDSGLANIKVAQSQHITIVDNVLSGTGTGRQNIELVAVDDAIIAGNDGSHSGGFNEIKGGSKRGVIYGNVAHDTGMGILIGGNCTGQQFLVDTNIDYEAIDLRVWGNVIYDIGGGSTSSAFPVVGCQQCIIANNTVYNAAALPMTVRLLDDGFGDADGNCTIPVHTSSVVLRNNLFAAQFTYMYNVSDDFIPTFDMTMTVDHNLYFGLDNTDATATYSDVPYGADGTSLYNVDPKLTSPPGDDHLGAGSLAVGAGVAVPGIPTSADGSCWSAAPNIGAF